MLKNAQNSSKKRRTLLKLLFILTMAVILPILLIAPQSHSQSAKKVKSQEEEIRNFMVTISRQLGVSCTTCHTTDNFKTDEKQAYKVAKEHLKLTQLLIDNGMDGKRSPKADCFMCHRGTLKPDYQEKIHPMLQSKENKESKNSKENKESQE